MCLLVIAHQAQADYPLIVAGNRDEFYARPTEPAHFWADHPTVFAGRDLQAGGTWMGLTRGGRFAALTNFRDPGSRKLNPKSRGGLVSGFLVSNHSPGAYLDHIASQAGAYDDFNLLVGNLAELWSLGSRSGTPERLAPGIYGLSNHLLNTPWPKVERARRVMSEALGEPPEKRDATLLAMLSDNTVVPDDALPETGVGLPFERLLSSSFIASASYGTRASTVLSISRQGTIDIIEMSFGPEGAPLGTIRERFNLEPSGATLQK